MLLSDPFCPSRIGLPTMDFSLFVGPSNTVSKRPRYLESSVNDTARSLHSAHRILSRTAYARLNLAENNQRPQKRPGYVTNPHRDAQKAVVICVETVGCMVSGVMVGYGPCATASMALRLCTITFRV